MAVDQALLQQLVDEIPFTDPNHKKYFLDSLKADEAAATQFVGQRLRHADYTKKTTELNTEKQTLAQKANQSVQTYAQQLAEMQAQFRKVMDDYSNEKISRTKAETILQKVKSVYNLSDDDIPKLEATPAQQQQNVGGGLTEARVQEMMNDFQQNLLKQLAPINQFPEIPVLIQDMRDEHMRLTGQTLPMEKVREYMARARQENGPSLRSAWEEEFKIPDLRKSKEREEWTKQERQKWEDEQKAQASQAALRQVTRGPDGKFQSLSPVMGRKYQEHVDPTNKDIVDNRQQQQQARETSGPKPTGAERAAQKWIERREQGIPMGQEAPTK